MAFDLGLGEIAVGLALLFAITVVVVTLHEAIHGVVLARRNPERPAFRVSRLLRLHHGARLVPAETAYVVIAVAPLIVLSILGVVLLAACRSRGSRA
ncbi:MAG: metalloprotease family protein [Chloroflexota bacterium]